MEEQRDKYTAPALAEMMRKAEAEGRLRPVYEDLVNDFADECKRLRAECERLRAACSTMNDEISQTLGRALRYPRFTDSQDVFPGATDANGVCVGDHVAESLAMEAAGEIERLRADAERYRWLRRWLVTTGLLQKIATSKHGECTGLHKPRGIDDCIAWVSGNGVEAHDAAIDAARGEIDPMGNAGSAGKEG